MNELRVLATVCGIQPIVSCQIYWLSCGPYYWNGHKWMYNMYREEDVTCAYTEGHDESLLQWESAGCPLPC